MHQIIFLKKQIFLKQTNWKDIFQNTNLMGSFTLLQNLMLTVLSFSPLDFVYTNVIGTVNLLNAAKKLLEWIIMKENGFIMFQPMKYMALWAETGFFTEKTLMLRILLTLLPKLLPIIL